MITNKGDINIHSIEITTAKLYEDICNIKQIAGELKILMSSEYGREACWRCGKFKSGQMSFDHSIPRHLKPVRNVVIPLCWDCHEEKNASDFQGMLKYLYKIKQIFNRFVRLVQEKDRTETTIGDMIVLKDKENQNINTAVMKNDQ